MAYVVLIVKVEGSWSGGADDAYNERERISGAVIDRLPEDVKNALVWGNEYRSISDVQEYPWHALDDDETGEGLKP